MQVTAFSAWKNRIAPVFDVSRSIRIVTSQNGRILRQKEAVFPGDELHLKANRLAELNVDVLVCGAISRSLQTMIVAHGIDVIPFVTGNLQEVIRAWLCGDHTRIGGYAMPGCRRVIGGRSEENESIHKGEDAMFSDTRERKAGNQRRASGWRGWRACQRRGSGKKGQNQNKGRQAAGNGATPAARQGFCVCPRCGYRVPHESGIPCVQLQCTQCGAIMGRS